jgi:hypothetical protein
MAPGEIRWNTTSLGNDWIKNRGHSRSSESGELYILSSYLLRAPLK